MTDRLPPFGPERLRVFRRSWTSRTPGPLGCLLMLVLCPIGLAVGLVALVLSFLPFGRRRVAATMRAATPEAAAREAALRRLVRAFGEDEKFSAEEARQAGTLVAGGATVDDLIADAIERKWIEVRADGLAVTKLGREETEDRPGA